MTGTGPAWGGGTVTGADGGASGKTVIGPPVPSEGPGPGMNMGDGDLLLIILLRFLRNT